jgi:hypothetical protein
MLPEQCSSLHGFIISIPLIETLHEMKPPLGGVTMEESALASKKREGYEECLSNILSLSNRGATVPVSSPFVDVRKHDEPVTQPEG